MAFPLNKRISNLKVHNKVSGHTNLDLNVVSVVRKKGDTTSLRILGGNSPNCHRISTARLLLQLKFVDHSTLINGAKAGGRSRYVVCIDASSQDFGKVGRITGGSGRFVYVDLLCDGTKLSVLGSKLRYIKDKTRLFDHNPLTGKISNDYIVNDWPNQVEHQEDTTDMSVKSNGVIGQPSVQTDDKPLTYKIQYVASDGQVFATTAEVNKYVDEQNKQRLHQKKMVLLKALAQEVGLEFEVDGSSIILK